ncbi:hypothetical protein C8R48DRAFT_699809 [Suillus tomentosus]|nr:hypothetical protein C8R48DRAFT_699809 [Suillus tomentosus]
MLSSLSSSVDDAVSFVRTLMIPFPALVPHMLHYHQPSELLVWTVDHHGLSEDIKVLAILEILRGLRMTVIDLLLCSVSQKPAMINWRKGFFRSSALARFLNVLESDEQGAIHLQNVLRPHAIELVTREIDVEMEDAKLIFHMSTKDITPEYLLSFDIEHGLTAPLKETTPWLRQILMSAMRTTCAVKENKHQNVETYCTVIQSQIANIRSQNNLAFQITHGLCLFSGGTSRKTIDLLAHCGLSPGYDALHTSHTIMADGQIRRAQLVARGPHMIGWDNIQVSTSTHVEQRALAPPKVQSDFITEARIIECEIHVHSIVAARTTTCLDASNDMRHSS